MKQMRATGAGKQLYLGISSMFSFERCSERSFAPSTKTVLPAVN
jgi:hypothetical protein